MYRISLFVEDRGHEVFLRALIERLAKHYDVLIDMKFLSARGGHGKVISQLKGYSASLQKSQLHLPDLVIVAIDGNCKGFLECKQEIDSVMKGFSGQIIYAIPDPHIERWLLLDSMAFKTVLGKGCSAPAQKCERDLYKRLLLDAVRKAGINPPLGGIEYTEELVHAMDLQRLEQNGDSLSRLLSELRHMFQAWERNARKESPYAREAPNPDHFPHE